MSAFTIKSVAIRDREASPPVLNNPEATQGYLKVAMQVENTSNEGSDIGDAGSTIRLVNVPSNARIDKVEYSRADLGTSSLDIAVWYPAYLPQGAENSVAQTSEEALISSSAFLGAISADTASAWTDGMGANVTPAINVRPQPLWEMLGLANDPGIDLVMGFTVRTANATNGYVGLRVQYVD
jgi:hypothetical protein